MVVLSRYIYIYLTWKKKIKEQPKKVIEEINVDECLLRSRDLRECPSGALFGT